MSEIKNGGLDQYGTNAYKQQQFGTAGVEEVVKPIYTMQLYLVVALEIAHQSVLCVRCS